LPARNRQGHGRRLLEDLDDVQRQLEHLRGERRAAGIADDRGIVLEFASDPNFELALRSLDRRDRGSRHIELLAVRERGGAMLATVLVPEGKLQQLTSLVEKYLGEDTPSGRPKNRVLVESVAAIRRAALESFWTDDDALFPQPGQPAWWEVWLRVGGDRQEILDDFRLHAARLGLQIKEQALRFPDRTVLLAHASSGDMARSAELLDCIAELRRAKEPPSFFTEMSPREQAAWVDAMLERVVPPGADSPAVCLLDTGVNNEHPLLRVVFEDRDVLTCNPSWGRTDHRGHGTEMAGLAAFGDLSDQLATTEEIPVEHRLESVKLLPPPGFPESEPELWGVLTGEAVGRAEINAPHRRRAVCMTVSAPDYRDRGRPSSWSAEVDRICAGFEDEQQRLLFLAAGNVEEEDWSAYPDYNDIAQVHDPGQAWNAVTVGAFTEKSYIAPAIFPGWEPVARPGTLSPSSSTSTSWASEWPNKPDIVMEGGNAAVEPGSGVAVPLDDLVLLTTHWRPTEKLLVPTWATSAATAQAARLAAILMARYPGLWPETIRALLVHSADWTEGMRAGVAGLDTGDRKRVLLRRYGYGVPNLAMACWSASNILTLVAQDSFRPFDAPRGSSVPTKDMNLHRLPWPVEALQDLGEVEVELRVTLSYFVEPNPARRGWKYRHRYRSHGLRFSTKKAGEGEDDFRARVSKDAQNEDEGIPSPGEPGWLIGSTRRDLGALHSDRWVGTAVDLADRACLAVYPVGGWWKERPHLGRWERAVRYALVVSIVTPETEVDIYTPVATQIEAEVPVSVAG